MLFNQHRDPSHGCFSRLILLLPDPYKLTPEIGAHSCTLSELEETSSPAII